MPGLVVDDPTRFSNNGPSFGRLSNTYRFFGQIGAGGMGVIYKAHHAMLKKDVAIKILHQVNEVTVQRFQREAQAAYNLHHENVVAVHEFGVTDEGQPFMVMEFIEGKTLANVIDERGALPLDLCVNIFKQVCSGMSHAHAKGVLHRDLKPSNIMLTAPDSWTPQVRIVDFGIAKVMDLAEDDTSTGKLTRTGDFVGSPLYMSPEQCLGKNIDRRSDIYSIGCIMFEALTGQAPFTGGTQMEIMLRQMNDKAPSLKEGSGGTSYPTWIERLVARALAKDPNLRFQSIDELRKAIEDRVVADVGTVSNDGLAKKIGMPVIVGGSVALLAVAAAGVFFATSQTKKPVEKMPSELLAEQFPNLKIDKTGKQQPYNDVTNDPSVMAPPSHDDILARSVADRLQTEISCQNQPVNDSSLYGLKDRVDIKSLSLGSTNITDKALQYARHLPLVKVGLEGNARITDKVLQFLNPVTLEELYLSSTGFRSPGVAALAKFKNLRVLTLVSDKLNEKDFSGLASCTSLIDLNLSKNPQVKDAACTVLSHLTKLRNLKLDETGVDGRGLAALKTLGELNVLSLNGTKVDDAGIIAIQNLPLTSLELQLTAITDGAIKPIAKIKTLRELGLQHVLPLSLDSIKLLASLPLNKLSIYNCGLDDNKLEILSHCKTLRELHLSGNNAVTPAGIEMLSKLPIQELNLQKMNITDQNLPLFNGWKNLRTLYLGDCPGITQAGVDRLKKAIGHDLSVLPFDDPNISHINFGAPF